MNIAPELLNKLKTNWTGFGGLSEEMQEAFKRAHAMGVDVVVLDSRYSRIRWANLIAPQWKSWHIYRLDKDWEPPIEPPEGYRLVTDEEREKYEKLCHGYRWVLPAKQEPTYVEYDVEASSARHPKWIVPAIGKSLVEASGCVGFAGCKFDGQRYCDGWLMSTKMFISDAGVLYESDCDDLGLKPAVPTKIRFFD